MLMMGVDAGGVVSRVPLLEKERTDDGFGRSDVTLDHADDSHVCPGQLGPGYYWQLGSVAGARLPLGRIEDSHVQRPAVAKLDTIHVGLA
jgi:hypothetical protein